MATAGVRALRARVPAGRWVLEALELSEPTGLQITNDHQNGESPAPATQTSVPITLGPLRALGRDGRTLAATAIGAWRAVGSGHVTGGGSGTVRIAFSESGLTTVVRPPAPSDGQPVPVLVDRATDGAAARGGRLGLEVDGLPVAARVVGVLTRFPSVAPGSAGFVIADEATLAGALEAQMPGQGAPDELWLAAPKLAPVRAALASGALASLTTTWRSDIERGLRQAPVARAVMTTLTGAAALAGGLAVLGLLVALVGALRDRELEDDLYAQGLGPRALRLEMRLRLSAAAIIGVACGLLVALALARLAVTAVQAAGAVAVPNPPLSAVAPTPLLLGWALGALAALIAGGWLATARLPRRGALMSEPLVALRDVFCVHRTPEGDAAALQGASLEVARGRDRVRARSQRRGQEHTAVGDRRAPSSPRPAPCSSTAATSDACLRAPGRRSATA